MEVMISLPPDRVGSGPRRLVDNGHAMPVRRGNGTAADGPHRDGRLHCGQIGQVRRVQQKLGPLSATAGNADSRGSD